MDPAIPAFSPLPASQPSFFSANSPGEGSPVELRDLLNAAGKLAVHLQGEACWSWFEMAPSRTQFRYDRAEGKTYARVRSGLTGKSATLKLWRTATAI